MSMGSGGGGYRPNFGSQGMAAFNPQGYGQPAPTGGGQGFIQGGFGQGYGANAPSPYGPYGGGGFGGFGQGYRQSPWGSGGGAPRPPNYRPARPMMFMGPTPGMYGLEPWLRQSERPLGLGQRLSQQMGPADANASASASANATAGAAPAASTGGDQPFYQEQVAADQAARLAEQQRQAELLRQQQLAAAAAKPAGPVYDPAAGTATGYREDTPEKWNLPAWHPNEGAPGVPYGEGFMSPLRERSGD